MQYLWIALSIIALLFAARFYSLRRAIGITAKQMEEIEKHPERNRRLRMFATDRKLEQLVKRINGIYAARQQERIVYQKRETQIRQEIENISHDLRTPLTSIIGYVELIKDRQTKEVERGEYLEIIQKRARLLQGFIQDFYELSRIEGDNYPLLPDILPVQNLLAEVMAAYYHEFQKKHIRVEVSLAEKQCSIIADRIQFNRILNNLIQNALKYAGNQFFLKQYCVGRECVIQFLNEKGGMDEEELKLIFERFYTGDLSRSNQSTGLGLAIAKLLVEKMKGKIEARLEGEAFVIELRWKMH